MSSPRHESDPDASRPRVVVLDAIDPDALDRLSREYDVRDGRGAGGSRLATLLHDAEAVVVRSGVTLSASVLDAAPQLRVIARAGAGVDNIDMDAARERGIQVFNIPGASANAVAEHAIGLTLALARNVALADRQLREGRWEKASLVGVELAGRRLGVVGLGAIGARVAALGQALGMRVVASVGSPSPERAQRLAADDIALVEIDDLLATADVVCLAVPLTPRTRGLISDRELALMRPTAMLVNVARGPVVDEDALHTALVSGGIAGAALDVFTEEQPPSRFTELDNVVLTPHLGGSSRDAQARIGAALVDQLRAAMAGHDVRTLVH